NRRDWDVVVALAGDGYAMRDRREMAWGTIEGGDELVTQFRTAVEEMPDVRVSLELLAGVVFEDVQVMGGMQRWSGTSRESGGPVELAYGSIGFGPLDAAWTNEVLNDDPAEVLER